MELTGLHHSPNVDTHYELVPWDKTFPKHLLKRRPYVRGDNDCDDRSKYGYCEIHDKHPRVPIVLVRGRVMGQGRHEFLIVGCIDSMGLPIARYFHRLEKEFEWIFNSYVTKVEDLW